MNSIRRPIFYLASAVGVWLLVSFAGAMVDSGNAAFWSDSLMWALLSALIVAPALLLVYDAFSPSQERSPQTRTSSAGTSSQSPSPRSESPHSEEEDQTPFVEEEERGKMRTLWPEPETEATQEDEWPPQEAYEDQDHIRA